METKDKMKLTLTIITLTAISLFSVAFYQRRRKHKNPPQICYLDTELNKPQSSFKRVLADNSYNPFKHLNRNRDNVLNVHPYEKEITELIGSNGVEFSRFFYGGADLDMEMKESYVWVDSEEELVKLVDVLSEERLFAVDIEHHSLRSFLGFTALLQISTQKEDYLVDTIALHDVMCLLRPVFSDPNICKVFHGADNDVTWLQRDFHIYIVNLFDTAKACEVLSKPHRSLAYLLETYCSVATNKMLQREDWRLRPLSEEMIQYARTDAHYLLYIASCMANELKKQTTENIVDLDDEFPLVREANRRSNMICLQLYTKEIEASPGESVAQSILSRNFTGQGGVSSNSEAKELVGRLCMWRDLMARVHDESLRYVLSDQAIVAVASKVPTTAIEIYDTISEADLDVEFLCGGSSVPSPSPVVCSHLEDICDLLAGKISNLGNVFQTLPQKHLGPSGCCPLSIYNYALLTKSNLRVTNGFSAKQNGIKSYKQFGRKASRSRQLFVKKFSCKSPVYHNCRIYASDGRLLCYCDRRKLDWYLSRDLAKLVENDPPGIMLLFEPKGRPEDEDNDFYIQSKKNICVGCGERNHYLRYRIVPSCYRMHFPEHLKSHRSHDIVLLCVDCHEVAHSVAEKHKRQIAAEFGIPLFVKKVTESSQTDIIDGTSGSEENVEEAGVSPLQLRAAAMALLRHGPNMPAKRREELTLTVMKYFGGRKISTDDLESALLVGMSPHQRRKHEKKRGLPFKHSTRGHLSNEANYNNADSIRPYTLTEAIKWDYKNGLETATEANLGMDMDASTRDIHKGCDSKVKGDAATTDGEDLNFNIASLSNKGKATDTGEDLEDKSLSDFTYNSSQCKPSGTVSSTYNQKMSLLGHGPHGKQVVDHLLNKYGEDGIRVFCQRWRQVFVEALHPRFLPSGWDVNHRGRRDFGEYSVYNPIKKSTITATD